MRWIAFASALLIAAGLVFLQTYQGSPRTGPLPKGVHPATQTDAYKDEMDRFVRRLNYYNRDAATVSAPDVNTIQFIFHARWEGYSEKDKLKVLRDTSDSFVDIRHALGIPFNPRKYPQYVPTVVIKDTRGRLLARHRFNTTEFFDPTKPDARPQVVVRKRDGWGVSAAG